MPGQAASFQNSSLISKEALRRLANNMAFMSLTDRQYSNIFQTIGSAPGVTVNVRKPVRLLGGRGSDISSSIQGPQSRTVPLTIQTPYHVAVELTAQQMALNLNSYSEEVVQPAMERIANDIDVDGLALALEVPNYVGTPGVAVSNINPIALAGARLTEEQVPDNINRRSACFSPTMDATFMLAASTLYNDQSKIAEQYRTGRMSRRALGFRIETVQNLPMHTVGALGGTPLVKGANQTGSTILCDGATASVTGYLKRGDIVTFGVGGLPVNSVNPSSYINNGAVRTFRATADVDTDGAGEFTIPIYPAIEVTGPYQTVTNAPADNAVVQVFGHAISYAGVTSKQGLLFDREFATFSSVDLMIPNDVHMGSRAFSDELGLSIRHIRFYDGMKDRMIDRFDVLGAWIAHRPELAVRLLSAA